MDALQRENQQTCNSSTDNFMHHSNSEFSFLLIWCICSYEAISWRTESQNSDLAHKKISTYAHKCIKKEKRSLALWFVKLRIYPFSSVSLQLRQHFPRP